MSRLFGYYGNKPVNFSCKQLLDDSGSDEEIKKADGWGIGFFRNNSSFLFKKAARSSGIPRITNIAEIVSSHVFISHLRRAEIGERKEANTQPFRWGNWLFAHQGTISRFRKVRMRIMRKLPSATKKQIRGSTDSEYCFFLFLTQLRGKGGIKKGNIALQDAVEGLKRCGSTIFELCREAEIEEQPRLNFLITNGRYLLASRRGTALFYLPQKSTGSAETTFYSRSTGLQYELLKEDDDAFGIIVASEPLSDSAGWREVPDNHILTVDHSLDYTVISWIG